MSQAKSQNEQILRYLQSGGKLTPLDALAMFGTMRLGARCYDLKKDGHKIISDRLKLASGKIVAEYRIDA